MTDTSSPKDVFVTNKGPDPNCSHCDGKGHHMYDHNHGKICAECCPHDQGWWLLSEHYAGYREGKETWCCKRGCGSYKHEVEEKEEG